MTEIPSKKAIANEQCLPDSFVWVNIGIKALSDLFNNYCIVSQKGLPPIDRTKYIFMTLFLTYTGLAIVYVM